MSVTPEAIRQLLDELEANRRSRRTAWATLQRLRKFLEASGARIAIPDDRNFETEGEAIESGLRRTVEGRGIVMLSLIRELLTLRKEGKKRKPIDSRHCKNYDCHLVCWFGL
jgi:hypothetical protein